VDADLPVLSLDSVGKLLHLFQVSCQGCSPDIDRLEQLGFDAGDHPFEHLDGISAPPVGTDHREEPGLGPEHVEEVCCIDCLRMRTEEDRGCPDDDCCRIHECHCEFPDIG